jgi:hypothetical protein
MNRMFIGTIVLMPALYIALGLLGLSDDPITGVQSVLGITLGVTGLIVYGALVASSIAGLFLIITSYLKQRQEFIKRMESEVVQQPIS